MRNLFPFVWVVGFIITLGLQHQRVGFPTIRREEGIGWREFLLGNVGWFFLNLVKAYFWFITLAVWLVQGMPKPAWRAVTTDIDGRAVRRIERVAANDRSFQDWPEQR